MTHALPPDVDRPGPDLAGLGRRAAALALAALSACALPVSPDAEPAAVPVPSAWVGSRSSDGDGAGSRAGAAAADERALAAWWLQRDDPGLAAVVALAVQANTRVEVARATWRQALALRDVVAASAWPALAGSATAQRGTAGGRSTGTTLRAGVDASWVPDVFGARRAGLQAAEAAASAGETDLADLQVHIAAEAALATLAGRTAQRRLQIAIDNLASQSETLQITRWREQAGLGTALESAQALAAVEQSRAQVPLLQAAIAQSSHLVSVLIGQPPAAGAERSLLEAGVAAASSPAAAPADPPLTLPARTLRQRPDVKAAEWRVTAALARLDQAEAQRRPSFSIGGSLALGGATPGALGRGDALLGSVLAGVTLPMLDGGALRAQVRVQQAALAQARQQYRAAVLTALQDVEDVLAALAADHTRLQSLATAAGAAAEAAALARQRYGSGLIDFQTVLETQRTQLLAQDGLASAQAALGSDQVRLFQALGGGWRAEASGPQPPAP